MSPWALAPLALTAGVLSFASPCVLPLLPAYLAYMTGAPGVDGADDRRGRVRAALAFCAGFTVVFTALGTAVSMGFRSLSALDIDRIAGLVLVAAGAVMVGVVRMPMLAQTERRPILQRAATGRVGGFVLGAGFAAGWTPCIGPVLAAVLTVSSTADTTWWGAGLLAVYSVGLGVPFVAVAAGIGRLRLLPRVRDHQRAIERAGGVLFALIGLAMVTGAWGSVMRPAQRWAASLDWPPL